MDYDADRAPVPGAWLSLPDAARLAAVEASHRALAGSHPASPKPRLHAALHMVVEDQAARGEPPQARRALERLVESGLSRHEAVHAVGRVAADAAEKALARGQHDAAAYARELDALTAEGWRSLGRE
jgi:hypothetical protein